MQIFFEIVPKFSDFVNSTDLIPNSKSHQNLSDYNQFLLKKIFEVNKKLVFSSDKIKNAGNCIYDYAHSFLGEDF